MVKKLTKWAYLEPFLIKEEPMHLAELSKNMGKPHATVRKYLNHFTKEGILKKQKRGRQTLYQLNQKAPLTDTLTLAEKDKLVRKCQESPLLKETIHYLHENLPLKSDAIIFGSFTETPETAKDIDLLTTKKIKVEEFEKQHGIKFEIINQELEKTTQALKEEIKKKHLIVQGTERVIKWMLKN